MSISASTIASGLETLARSGGHVMVRIKERIAEFDRWATLLLNRSKLYEFCKAPERQNVGLLGRIACVWSYHGGEARFMIYHQYRQQGSLCVSLDSWQLESDKERQNGCFMAGHDRR